MFKIIFCCVEPVIKERVIKLQTYQISHFLFGLGNLTPKTLSILARIPPEGTDLPASQALTSALGTWRSWANFSWVSPLLFLDCAKAILSSWGIVTGSLSSSALRILATCLPSSPFLLVLSTFFITPVPSTLSLTFLEFLRGLVKMV